VLPTSASKLFSLGLPGRTAANLYQQTILSWTARLPTSTDFDSNNCSKTFHLFSSRASFLLRSCVAAVQTGDIDAVTVRRLIESRATSDHAASQSDRHLLLLLLKDLLLELAVKYTEVYTGHSCASMYDEDIKPCKVTNYPTGDDVMEILLRLKAKSGEEMEVRLRRKCLFIFREGT
jgi:hypothetical protein